MAIPAIGIFMFAWSNQFKSNIILADLRKDGDSKKVISQKYFLPHDGWFKYVSSPHQLCEIMLYLSLTLLLFKNVSWLFVVFWVVSNQVIYIYFFFDIHISEIIILTIDRLKLPCCHIGGIRRLFLICQRRGRLSFRLYYNFGTVTGDRSGQVMDKCDPKYKKYFGVPILHLNML